MTKQILFQKLFIIAALCAGSFLLGYKSVPAPTVVYYVSGNVGGSGGTYLKEEQTLDCLAGTGANDPAHAVSVNNYCGLK